MSNKPRGLGRGLGDLLADNAPEVRASSVIRRDEDGEVSISPYAQEATETSNTRNYSEEEISRPLVFPAVTPVIGGSAAREDAEDEPIDEAKEILEAEAAITGKSLEELEAEMNPNAEAESERGGAGNSEQTIVYPRSLKAVFRNFK